MHGRVKTRTTAEQQEVKRKEREKKVKLYRAGIEKLFKKREDGLLDEEILEISGQLLSANPDIYTLWNLRREVVLHLREQRGEDDVQQLMENELRLTEQCLRANPKSYGAWHHRAWVLDTMPKPDWKRELALCNKYLELDERNFHTWDYRNFVVQRSKVPAEEEYTYSTLKITTNFSNYSSWHYRSRLLPIVYPDPHNKRPIREDKHKEELELVQNAAFTDPNDQSAWFYQRWLLGRAYQPPALSQAFVSRCLIFAAVNQSVRLCGDEKESPQLELQVANQPVTGTWVAGNGQHNSHVWIFLPTCELFQGDGLSGSVVINLYYKGRLADSMVLKQGSSGEEFWGHKKAQFGAQFSEILTYVLEDELQSCLQLMDLEPDSKWTLLTTVLLMQAIDRHRYREETMTMLSQLISVDPLRTGYYKDLRSRYEIEYAIDVLEEGRLDGFPPREFNLNGHGLTALYHSHQLTLMQIVNLSNNELVYSLPQLYALQCCKVLKLDNNQFKSLAGMPSLPKLTVFSIKHNHIKDPGDLKYLQQCISLISIDLRGNPIESEPELNDYARTLLPSLTIINDGTLRSNVICT